MFLCDSHCPALHRHPCWHRHRGWIWLHLELLDDYQWQEFFISIKAINLQLLGYLQLSSAPKHNKLLSVRFKSIPQSSGILIRKMRWRCWNRYKKKLGLSAAIITNFSPSSNLPDLYLIILWECHHIECLEFLHNFVNSPQCTSPDYIIFFLHPSRTGQYHYLNIMPYTSHANIFI